VGGFSYAKATADKRGQKAKPHQLKLQTAGVSGSGAKRPTATRKKQSNNKTPAIGKEQTAGVSGTGAKRPTATRIKTK